jgi:hypothetical protein
MAGSYKHCIKEDYSFNADDFHNMIENLGDAYEACEEMVWLIWYLSGGNKEKIEEAISAYYAKDAINK